MGQVNFGFYLSLQLATQGVEETQMQIKKAVKKLRLWDSHLAYALSGFLGGDVHKLLKHMEEEDDDLNTPALVLARLIQSEQGKVHLTQTPPHRDKRPRGMDCSHDRCWLAIERIENGIRIVLSDHFGKGRAKEVAKELRKEFSFPIEVLSKEDFDAWFKEKNKSNLFIGQEQPK